MSSRTANDVRTPVSNLWIETVKIEVTGSGVGDMTGSIIGGTQLNAVVSFPSGTVAGYGFTAPSGSFLITLPPGGSVGGPPNGRYPTIMSWHVDMEASGTDINSDARATINSFDVYEYGHSAASGTFLAGFVRASGSLTNGGNAVMKGAVPEDRCNPNSMAAKVNITFIGRNSTARV